MLNNTEDIKLINYLMGNNAFVRKNESKKFSYISNTDGTIRWLYPSDLKRPTFLNFYSTSSLRAKILSSMIKLAFFAGQRKRIESGELELSIDVDSRLGKVLKAYPNACFSIFTGTVGENRKAVIELHNKERVIAFVKIALTEAAKVLVDNEMHTLKKLSQYRFDRVVVPEILYQNYVDTIGLSNIKPKTFTQAPRLMELHVEALHELYEKTHENVKWSDLDVLQECKKNIEILLADFEVFNDLKKNRIHDLAGKLLKLLDMIEKDEEVTTVALSHGDFTPWNMYVNEKLYLFDWELSQDNMPLLFDLFHFVFQSEVMIKHTTYNNLVNELKRIVGMKNIQKLFESFQIDVNNNYLFYLSYNISYYLNKYIRQEQLHDQVFWLINIWEDAVNDLISKQGILFET